MLNSVSYIGKSEYCYANSVAMLLSSIGENISPNKIEVLTGVGLGSFLTKGSNLLFFSNLCGLPDKGIGYALKCLGFEFKEGHEEKSDKAPFDKLQEALKTSPVVIGPLDIGLLTYNPHFEGAIGSDHYALVYGMDKERVYLHDPWGYPHVFLTLDELKEAWKAEKVSYKRGFYRYWYSPKRVSQPSEKEIYSQATQLFIQIYNESEVLAKKQGWKVFSEAILTTAEAFETREFTKDQLEHLIYFALPLAARRAMDFAEFFSSRNKELANLKNSQAKLFGHAHTFAVQKTCQDFAKALREIAKVEKEFYAQLMVLP